MNQEDKVRRIGVSVDILTNAISRIEERNSFRVYDEVLEEFGKHMSYMITSPDFAEMNISDLRPINDVLEQFQNRYFKRDI